MISIVSSAYYSFLVLGKQGAQLSGGQKQRIALARALIRKPQILLLDDTTSALDAESEQIVQRALDDAKVGRTTIIVSHRLSTIVASDVVAYIGSGKVMEMGTHDKLMTKEGLYASLIHTQVSWLGYVEQWRKALKLVWLCHC